MVLNADGARGVDTSIAAKAEVAALRPLSIGLIIGGAVMFLLGLAMMLIAAAGAGRSRRDDTTTSVRAESAAPQILL